MPTADPSDALSPRHRRLLRAILPAGVGLLVLWVVYVAIGIVSLAPAMNLASALLGLVTSVLLIAFGVSVRRQLPPA
jgi:ABC-type transport system involved in cytochrome bd biosynthesis fused ATPase/permease subunit